MDADVDQDATASILARHDDVVTVSVKGAGTVSVRVDGDGPELLDVTPADLDYVRSQDLEYAFTVRDDDAGLRHDGELVVTEDGDYTQVNADDDHTTTGEPLSMPSAGEISVNGASAEIDVMVWSKDAHVNTGKGHHGTRALDARGEPSGRCVRVLGGREQHGRGRLLHGDNGP